MESWELRIAIPGNAEPLYLGEWGLWDEALAEIEAWRAQRTGPSLAWPLR